MTERTTCNKQVQTTIHCFPHVLVPDQTAIIFSDRGCQTAVSTAPQSIDTHFYALLEFIPYQAIAEGSIKVLDLPRKALLQWNLPSGPLAQFSVGEIDAISSSSSRTSGEVNKQKGVLKKTNSDFINVSLNRFHHLTMQRPTINQEIQTNLTVAPHVLETNEVANVYAELSIQTSITCHPNESISTILPQLKANLSHTSGYVEASSAIINQPPEIEPSVAEEEIEKIEALTEDEVDETTLELTENPQDETSELVGESPEELLEESSVDPIEESPEAPVDNTPDEPLEQSEDELNEKSEETTAKPVEDQPEDMSELHTDVQSTQVDTLSVTISAGHVKTQNVCSCREKLVSEMASKLRVQTSTLKLTPVAFPPNVPFADRMVEVLNTIIAVLQTEMANLMEVCVEEEKNPCGCTERSTQMSITNVKDDPRSCKCANLEAATNTDHHNDIANDPRSCKCGAHIVPSGAPRLAQGSQKEIKQVSTTRQVMNSNTMQLDLVKEDIVEETIKTITLSSDKETIIEEKTVTKTVREKLPKTPDTSKPTKHPCECASKIEMETFQPTLNIPENVPEIADSLVTESDLPEDDSPAAVNSGADLLPEENKVPEDDSAEPVNEIADFPEEDDELPETPAELVSLPADKFADENELPDFEHDVSVETPQQQADEVPDELPIEAAPEIPIQPQMEIGDGAQNKRLSFIPCECHPTETGAAVPLLALPGPSTQGGSEPDNKFDPCSCDDDQQPTTTDIANASSNIDDLTDEAPSLADDAPSEEKAIKFEILLKKGIKDVQSVSATSAIVVHATMSCPNSSKDGKSKVSAKNSLPDLSEQVIRLRVVYKTKPTEPESQIEELLTPSHPVTIVPYKSPSTHVDHKASKISTTVSIKSKPFGTGEISEPNKLVCTKEQSPIQKVPSKKISYNKSTTTDLCDCTPQGYLPQRPAFDKLSRNLPYETEKVPFSSMACPIHSEKAPACTSACPPNSGGAASTPAPATSKANNIANVEVTISYNAVAEDDKLKSSSFMYEHDVAYDEPYMDELVEAQAATTGCQTDLALGDKLQSESLNSLGEAEYKEATKVCSSKTEIPWQRISLPPPGSYSITPTKELTKQVGVMADADETQPQEGTAETEPDNTVNEEQEEGDVETEEAENDATEESQEETNDAVDGEAQEEAESGVSEEPPGEPDCGSECGTGVSRKKEPLLFESETYKQNEPYMESLYRAYPDADEEECGSQTEIPWKDIILPEHCKIRKVPKAKKYTCNSVPGKLSGMFVPSNVLPGRTAGNEDDELFAIHVGFDEIPSTMMGVEGGGAAAQQTVSYVSTVSDMLQKPKRVEKTFTLVLNPAAESVSFQTGSGKPQDLPIGSVLGPTSSQPFSVSAAFQGTSSVVINIKPSTECQYVSEKIPVPEDNERLVQIVNPSVYQGNNPTETKSCTSTSVAKSSNCMKNAASMPQIPSQKSIKATVSLKRLDQPDKVVKQTLNVTPGENRMTLNVPNTPVNVNVKISTPTIQANAAPSSCQGPCPTVPCPALTTEPKKIFEPAKCVCKDKVKLDTFKQDPVMAALEAYEAEMRPLRQALTQLQEKIRNLDMPEMKGCFCSTLLQNPPAQICEPCRSTNVQNKVNVSADPNTSVRTTTRVKPNPPGTCRYYHPAGFHPPAPPAYSYLPPPTIPPRYEMHVATPPNYMPPNSGRHEQNGGRYCPGSSGHKRHRSNRDYKSSCPRQDLATEARHYGMYPDYRGRAYSNEVLAYQDSFLQESRHKKGARPDKYRTRCVISIHSSGNLLSDYSACDSQGTSGGEDSYHLPSGSSRKGRKRGKRSNDSKTSSKYKSEPSNHDQHAIPCKDFYDNILREGQAVKTSPDEFLSCPSSSGKKRVQHSVPSIVSKTKLQIRFPRT